MFASGIEWDGTYLIGRLTVDGQVKHVRATREMIHALSHFNDALDWEIERFKDEIFDRLKPVLLARGE